ncbi:3253_t:CDS:2, partial [Ambispora leptoticha]
LEDIDINEDFGYAEENGNAKQKIYDYEINQTLQQSLSQFKHQNSYKHCCQNKQSNEINTQEYNEISKKYSRLIKENEELKNNAEKLNRELQNKKEIWEQTNKKNQDIINNLNEEIESLKSVCNQNQEIIDNLSNEIVQYQSAFGDLINVRLDNQDPNNPVNLTKDVHKLREALYDFTFLKGKAYIINKDNVQQLFNILKTKASTNHKPSVSAALQRLTIKKILKDYNDYMNTYMTQDKILSTYNSSDNKSLERRLVTCVDNLTSMVKDFNKTREGNDNNAAGITEIQIRQEIYAMLGNRGFGQKGNQVINDLKKALLKMLEHYRAITDDTISKKQEDHADEIILGIIRIFKYRLLTQEPIVTFRWFEHGEPLNDTLMEWVSAGEDETNMFVDICAFPAIGVNFDDPTKCQIYTKAQVQICNIPTAPKEKQMVSKFKQQITISPLSNTMKQPKINNDNVPQLRNLLALFTILIMIIGSITVPNDNLALDSNINSTFFGTNITEKNGDIALDSNIDSTFFGTNITKKSSYD